MSRFDHDDEEGIPWPLWEQIIARKLGGRKGQELLAEIEAALVALPEAKLVSGHLAAEGSVCTVGAVVARRRADGRGGELTKVIESMQLATPCRCGHDARRHVAGYGCTEARYFTKDECACASYVPGYESIHATAEAGAAAGLEWKLAWHFAYLNDETFARMTPEERYEQMLAWVRRAQGKQPALYESGAA